MSVKKLFVSSSPKNSCFICKEFCVVFSIVFSGNSSNSANQGTVMLCFIIIETLPGNICYFRSHNTSDNSIPVFGCRGGRPGSTLNATRTSGTLQPRSKVEGSG